MSIRALVKKTLYIPSDCLKLLYFSIKKIKFPKKARIRGKVYIINRGKIEFGDNLIINGGNKFNPIGFCGVCNFVAEKGAEIKIGNNFGASGVTLYSRCSIKIGNNVMLGGGVKIYDTDFHSLDHTFRGTPADKENTTNKPIILEDDVFVGAGSIILKGVEIGSQSVIGAGSVVTKSVPAGEIWAGNPAKFIRKI